MLRGTDRTSTLTNCIVFPIGAQSFLQLHVIKDPCLVESSFMHNSTHLYIQLIVS